MRFSSGCETIGLVAAQKIGVFQKAQLAGSHKVLEAFLYNIQIRGVVAALAGAGHDLGRFGRIGRGGRGHVYPVQPVQMIIMDQMILKQ